MMPRGKINEMYWSGYCNATIARAAVTMPGEAGKRSRMEWLQRHVPQCEDCTKANIMKALEYETSAELGPEAMVLFQRGVDIMGLPGAKDALRRVLTRAIEAGIVTFNVAAWMADRARRYGKDWPGLDGQLPRTPIDPASN